MYSAISALASHLIADAKVDPRLSRNAQKEKPIEPRRESLRQVLAIRALDVRR
jgi:hypothetical protein